MAQTIKNGFRLNIDNFVPKKLADEQEASAA